MVNKCDLCGKRITKKTLVTVVNPVEKVVIGHLHLKCFLKLPSSSTALFKKPAREVWSRQDWYKELIDYAKELEEYEKTKRTRNDRKD